VWRAACRAAVVVILVSSPGSAKAELVPGEQIRLMTAPAPEPSHPDMARILHEDSTTITMRLSPGDGPSTWTRPGRWMVGRLVALDKRQLRVELQALRDTLNVRREDIDSLQVRAPGRSRGKGALVGAMTGAVLGAVLYGSSSDNSPSADEAAMGAFMLAPLGLLIGLATPPGNEWKDVSQPHVHMGLAPGPRRAAVAVTVEF